MNSTSAPETAAPLVPTGTEALVCADIVRRQAHGLAKYGKTVADNPLTPEQWLQHLYEELLDGAVYAKRLMPLLAQNTGAWDALRMIRDAIETLGPIGALASEEATSCVKRGPTFVDEAAEMVAGIQKITAERDALRAQLETVEAACEAQRKAALREWNRAEAAEARVRDLEAKYHEASLGKDGAAVIDAWWHRGAGIKDPSLGDLQAQLQLYIEARLAAVLGALSAYQTALSDGPENMTQRRAEELNDQANAARTGDAAHPDSVTLAAVLPVLGQCRDALSYYVIQGICGPGSVVHDAFIAARDTWDAAKAGAGVDVAALLEDKAIVDWLEALMEGGVNRLEHKGPSERAHAYFNKRWIEKPGQPGQHAEYDHIFGPTIRAVINSARARDKRVAKAEGQE